MIALPADGHIGNLITASYFTHYLAPRRRNRISFERGHRDEPSLCRRCRHQPVSNRSFRQRVVSKFLNGAVFCRCQLPPQKIGQPMSTFVLVHGAWHTGEHLSPIVEHLQSLGHIAVAPTLLGHGDGADPRVSHAQQVSGVADLVIANDLRDFILVGHSFGGSIIARLAEEIGDRIRRLVFWNAFVPQRGNAVMDEVPPEYRMMFEQSAASSEHGSAMLPFDVWREAFINDADLDLAKSSYEALCPEPLQPGMDKLD
jgi:pimeloyl-ACP methyl ester carboxylesterase